MLGRIPKNFESWTFGAQRGFLLTHSYAFHQLISKFLNRHNLASLSPKSRSQIIEHSSQKIIRMTLINPEDVVNIIELSKRHNKSQQVIRILERGDFLYHTQGKIYNDIQKSAATYKVSPEFIKAALINLKQLSNLRTLRKLSLPIFTTYPGPIKQEGFYIKVNPHTREETIIHSYKQIKKELKDINKYLDKYQNARDELRERRVRTKLLRKKIAVYVYIEKIVSDSMSYQINSGASDKPPNDPYNGAFEEAAYNIVESHFLPNITNKHQVKTIYQQICRTYAIPTLQTALSCI